MPELPPITIPKTSFPNTTEGCSAFFPGVFRKVNNTLTFSHIPKWPDRTQSALSADPNADARRQVAWRAANSLNRPASQEKIPVVAHPCRKADRQPKRVRSMPSEFESDAGARCASRLRIKSTRFDVLTL